MQCGFRTRSSFELVLHISTSGIWCRGVQKILALRQHVRWHSVGGLGQSVAYFTAVAVTWQRVSSCAQGCRNSALPTLSFNMGEREDAVGMWLKHGGFVAAIGASGTGVVYIVHVDVGAPYRLIDLAQESGHGGRNGEAVDSIILLDNKEYANLEKRDAAAMTTDLRVTCVSSFRKESVCSFALGQYLDVGAAPRMM
jgi:hypothetical protein